MTVTYLADNPLHCGAAKVDQTVRPAAAMHYGQGWIQDRGSLQHMQICMEMDVMERFALHGIASLIITTQVVYP